MNALGHGNVTSEPPTASAEMHLQLFSYLQKLLVSQNCPKVQVCSGLKTSVPHFRPPKSSKMSQPSTYIHEMSFSCELLFVKLYCDRVELQPFVLVNLWNSFPRFTICGVSAVILLGSLITLGYIDEDEERHNFGHEGGFLCPFVPYLPVLCILINTYLIINIGAGTWIRVLVWLLIGSMIYLFYGRSHSLLNNAVYVPRTTCTRKTTDHLA